MTLELYVITAIVTIIFIAGSMTSSKIKRKIKDRESVVSWYNHLIDQYTSIYENIAECYNETYKLAEKYTDQDCITRLHKLYEDTNKTLSNLEQKMESLKSCVEKKDLGKSQIDELFNGLKIVESYIAELANLSMLIHSIHPVNRTQNAYDDYYGDFCSDSRKEENKPWKSSKFFSVCNNKDDLIKKYRELAKIYHPDNSVTGNAEYFKELKEEYDKYLQVL